LRTSARLLNGYGHGRPISVRSIFALDLDQSASMRLCANLHEPEQPPIGQAEHEADERHQQ
jgi:hypothetical protein